MTTSTFIVLSILSLWPYALAFVAGLVTGLAIARKKKTQP